MDRGRNGSHDLGGLLWCGGGGDHWFSRGGRFMTGVFRFLRGTIYIIDVPIFVRFGRSLVRGSPSAVDEEFVQDLRVPGNANRGGEPGRPLPPHIERAFPLLKKKTGV